MTTTEPALTSRQAGLLQRLPRRSKGTSADLRAETALRRRRALHVDEPVQGAATPSRGGA